ncbi:hypothetical protein T440DRAFT_400145 [Plenodomus tracheiphilus IPT5]|uniref:Uncharacterized protein n=1 Tax=Plenodomus tracheiphilus IPT5 TaxID=1408161 RepID=A0A6A7B0M2_9PLEO|nr:hypothetical protein T440DRAFT_400145 [Plenodomus tracheiphilus IPT5]
MASFGKILDLLDDRYLELQDVVGNVEPLPTLVPYDEYMQNVLVYRMDTSLDIYMALIQDFTERKARDINKELWTWCVQWKVEAAPPHQTIASPPSPKKPRLETQQLEVQTDAKTEKHKGPVYNVIQRRVINPALMLQDDMLRCLIDIVQVDSTLVPNFIEFLYRWIDFYEGDGTALKAAMRWEIPSLWEFEYHPLELPKGPRQAAHDTEKEDTARAVRAGTRTPAQNEEIDELKARAHTTKTREKPNLAELEEEVELSERLQYREVHYGIKPPKISQPIPRLVNIPRDPGRRIKYYAACFKSRQRAFNLLIEAGLTVQQISNYKKQQVDSARDTPQHGEGRGLRHYEKDAKAAQARFEEKEKEIAVRSKHMEIAISNRLAVEAGVAARSNVTADSTGAPLIPATPSYVPRPAMEVDLLQKLGIGQGRGEDRINFVPKPLVGKLKSKLFEGAGAMEWFNNLAAAGGMSRDLPSPPTALSGPPGLPSIPTPPLGSALPRLPTISTTSTPAPVGLSHQHLQVPTQPGVLPQSTADRGPFTDQQMAEFVSNLTPAQSHRVIQLMNSNHVTRAANLKSTPLDAPVAGPSTASASILIQPAPMSMNTALGHGTGHVQPPPSASQLPLGLGGQMTTTLPMRPSMPTSYSALAPGPSQPPPQRRVSSDPASLSYLLTLGSGGPMQRNNPQSSSTAQQHSLASRPSLPQLSQTPSVPLQPPLPQLFLHPPTPRPPPPNHPPLWGYQPPFNPDAPTIMPSNSFPWNAPQPPLQNPPTPPSPSPPRHHRKPITLPPTTPPKMPLLLYFPKILRPGNTLGPGGTPLGDNNALETDALLLGHCIPGTHTITLSRAIFLPTGIWQNLLRRVRTGGWEVLEMYPSGVLAAGGKRKDRFAVRDRVPHMAAYAKLEGVWGFMCQGGGEREEGITKRWRVSRGPMTLVERGSVWEGWGVGVDRGVEMGRWEREGAVKYSAWIDEGRAERSLDEEGRRRKREIEEWLAEEEEDISDEEGMET